MKKLIILTIIVATLLIGVPRIIKVNAAILTSGSATLSDSRINSATVTYTLQFSGVTLSAIKCLKVAFSDAVTAGSKPTGLTISSLALSGTSNYIPTPASWGVSNNNSTGVSSITFSTGETPASSSSRTVVLTTITNGSTANTSYYVQFSTYNNIDCSTSPVDSTVVAYVYTNGQTVSASIDPTLTFSIAGVASAQTVNGATTNITTTTTTVPFGTMTSGTNKIGAQDLAIATNAGSGYTITTKYTGAFTSTGGATIADFGSPNSAPTTFTSAGTAGFGYTTNDGVLGTGTTGRFTASGGNKWAAFTTSPLEVGYSAASVSETIRVGYQVGISTTTAAGSYTTTVIFIVTPIY